MLFNTPGECSVPDNTERIWAVVVEKCYTVTFKRAWPDCAWISNTNISATTLEKEKKGSYLSKSMSSASNCDWLLDKMPQWHFLCQHEYLTVRLPVELALKPTAPSPRAAHLMHGAVSPSHLFFVFQHWALCKAYINETACVWSLDLWNSLRGREGRYENTRNAFQKEPSLFFPFCSGQVLLWCKGGTLGVAGIITEIMRWCSRERGTPELNELWFSNRLFEVKPERGKKNLWE